MTKLHLRRGLEAHQYESEDIIAEWTLSYGGRKKIVEGPLSKALYEAALLTAAHKEVKISDSVSGSVFFLRG